MAPHRFLMSCEGDANRKVIALQKAPDSWDTVLDRDLQVSAVKGYFGGRRSAAVLRTSGMSFCSDLGSTLSCDGEV